MKPKPFPAISLILIILVLTTTIASCSTPGNSTLPATTAPASTISAPVTRTVIDLIGRSVTIPNEVNKVACLVGPSYDKTFMLGGKDKIAMVGAAQSPWAQHLNAGLANIPKATNAQSPNVEELIQKKSM